MNETAVKTSHTTESTTRVTWGPIQALLVTLGVYFAGQFLGGISLYTLLTVSVWRDQRIIEWLADVTVGQFVGMAFIEAATFILLYTFIRCRGSSLRTIGLNRPRLRYVGYALAGYAMYFVAYYLIFLLIENFVPSINTAQKQQIGFETITSNLDLLLVFVSLVVLPPIIEEIVCRGFLYSGLKTKLPVIIAALITSVLFAIPHLQIGSGQPLLWVAAIDTFILSLVLVYLREKSGSLWSSISLHAMKNGVAFVALFVL